MKRYLLGFALGSAICLEPTLAFGIPVSTVQGATSNVSGAAISGTVMYQDSSNNVTTITGQITLPQNYYYSGNATITYQTSSTDPRPTGLTLGPTDSTTIKQVDTSSSITAVTAKELQDAFTAKDLPKAISIIRAAGGANGLE